MIIRITDRHFVWLHPQSHLHLDLLLFVVLTLPRETVVGMAI